MIGRRCPAAPQCGGLAYGTHAPSGDAKFRLDRSRFELCSDRDRIAALKGAEILLRRHKLVLVNDTADAITAQNADIIAWRGRGNRPSWRRWRERQRAMGPVTVVVIAERRNHSFKVFLVQNQQAVETF